MFNKYKNEIRQLREENADLRKALDQLEDAPEGCKRGAWCRACCWNKPIMVRFNGYGAREIAGVCMKGCCESFIEKVAAEDK